jgi:hypothetical protein
MKLILILVGFVILTAGGVFFKSNTDARHNEEETAAAEAAIRKFWDLAVSGETKKADEMTFDGALRVAGFDLKDADCCKISKIKEGKIKLGEKIGSRVEGRVAGFLFKTSSDNSKAANYIVCAGQTKHDSGWKMAFVSNLESKLELSEYDTKDSIDYICFR